MKTTSLVSLYKKFLRVSYQLLNDLDDVQYLHGNELHQLRLKRLHKVQKLEDEYTKIIEKIYGQDQ